MVPRPRLENVDIKAIVDWYKARMPYPDAPKKMATNFVLKIFEIRITIWEPPKILVAFAISEYSPFF
jgi:hypothetical protein